MKRSRFDIAVSEAANPAGAALVNGLHRLAPLLERVANETHPTELAGDEDARHAGLEARRQQRDLDAPPLGAEDESDRFDRARRAARAVTDAVGRAHELRASADDAEHVMLRLFRTDLHAAAATDAARRIDDRMQGRRLPQARCARELVSRGAECLQAPPSSQIDDKEQCDRDAVDQKSDRIKHNFRLTP
jgi:hypothetical protein